MTIQIWKYTAPKLFWPAWAGTVECSKPDIATQGKYVIQNIDAQIQQSYN